MKKQSIITLILIALVVPARAQDTNATYTTEIDKVSYAIGYNVGANLKRQDYEVDPDIIEQGIRDILEGNEPAMSENDARQTLQAYQQKLFQKRQEVQAAEAAENKKLAAEWLAENAEKDGVITTESGLQYKILTEGDGESPAATDTVQVNYRGTLIDGTEFDSSYGRGQPSQFKVNKVVRGWTEALQMMKTGGKWQLFIPSDLAYGDRPQGNKIKAGSTLIFEVELLEIIKPQPVTSDIIKVPSAEEMKKGAQIETIKASDLKRIEAEAKKAKAAEAAE